MVESSAITPPVTTRKPPSKAEPTSSRKQKPLTSKARSHLRGLGHALDAVVQIGKTGITRGLLDEVGRALDTHELIKVRVMRECPLERDVVAEQVATGCRAEHLQTVGGVLLFYRARPKKPIVELPGVKAAPAKRASASRTKPHIHHGPKRRGAGNAHPAAREFTNKKTRTSKAPGARTRSTSKPRRSE